MIWNPRNVSCDENEHNGLQPTTFKSHNFFIKSSILMKLLWYSSKSGVVFVVFYFFLVSHLVKTIEYEVVAFVLVNATIV